MQVGRSRRARAPEKRGGQPAAKHGWLWTPYVVVVETVLDGRLASRTVLIWELGGEEWDRTGVTRFEVCRMRPELALGHRYELSVEPCAVFASELPGYMIRSLRPHDPAGLSGGFGGGGTGGAGLGLTAGTTCGEMTYNARWLYDPPSMSWDQSLLGDFDERLRDNYHAAAPQWSGAQGGAPEAPNQDVPQILFASATWDEANFVDVQVDDYLGVNAATLALQWQDANFTPNFDSYAGTWTRCNTSDYLQTCLGMIASRLEYVRVAFNTNFVWDDPNDEGSSPNSQGVWVHEIGHLLGLPHRGLSCAQASIMKPVGSIQSTWSNWYARDDDDFRIRLLYPREHAFPVFSQVCP